MGCGANLETNARIPESISPGPVPVAIALKKNGALDKIRSYDTWFHVFDYLTMRELAKASQVCRLVSG